MSLLTLPYRKPTNGYEFGKAQTFLITYCEEVMGFHCDIEEFIRGLRDGLGQPAPKIEPVVTAADLQLMESLATDSNGNTEQISNLEGKTITVTTKDGTKKYVVDVCRVLPFRGLLTLTATDEGGEQNKGEK
jgi:hypothetical protein